MNDSKEGVLPLVGRVLKKRLSEFSAETKEELREGYATFRDELRDELGDQAGDQVGDEKPENGSAPKTRIETVPE